MYEPGGTIESACTRVRACAPLSFCAVYAESISRIARARLCYSLLRHTANETTTPLQAEALEVGPCPKKVDAQM